MIESDSIVKLADNKMLQEIRKGIAIKKHNLTRSLNLCTISQMTLTKYIAYLQKGKFPEQL